MVRRRTLVLTLVAVAVILVVGAMLYAQLAVPEHPTAVHASQSTR